MTFSIDNPRGLQQPPLGKYVWEKPSGKTRVNCLWTTVAEFHLSNIDKALIRTSYQSDFKRLFRNCRNL